MIQPNPKTDFFFAKAGLWAPAVTWLCAIFLGTDLAKELKWGCLCYKLDGANVALIHGSRTIALFCS